MKRRIFRICDYLLVVGGMFMFATRFAQASDVSQLSGSYQVMRKTEVGSQTQVRLQLHFANHTQRDLHIQRLTLWDSPHLDKRGTQKCSLIVSAGASVDTTQEFIIPRSEYRQWSHGARPRLLLEVQTPGGHTATEVVWLDRISGGEAN